MRQNTGPSGVVAALGTLLITIGVARAGGDDLIFNGAGLSEIHPCNGRRVVINGASNEITLTGECGSVLVNGSQHHVSIEAARQIGVSGTHNRVTWARAIGKAKRPRIRRSGINNRISRAPLPELAYDAEPADGAGTIVSGAGGVVVATTESSSRPADGAALLVSGNHRKVRHACGGQDVVVIANHGTVTLTGDCGTVEVSGNHNKVTVDAAAAISTPGNHNKVSYRLAPRLFNAGNKNQLTRR